MMLCNACEDPEVQDEYLTEIKAFRVTAIVMLAAFDTPRLRVAVQDSTPFLFVNRRPPKGLKGHFVGIDNGAAAGRCFGAFIVLNRCLADRDGKRVVSAGRC
jgi:DNA-binding LacI/PurR family transcriptional regulator